MIVSNARINILINKNAFQKDAYCLLQWLSFLHTCPPLPCMPLATHIPHHACPLPHMLPCQTCPFAMNPCHTCPLHHACPPSSYTPSSPCTTPVNRITDRCKNTTYFILLVKILFAVILEQIMRKETCFFFLIIIYIHSRPLRSLDVSVVWNIGIYELIWNNTVKIRNDNGSLVNQIHQARSVIIV